VETARQMKGKKRVDYIERVRDRDFKRIRTYINHLQTTLNFSEHSIDQQELQHQRGLAEQYNLKLEKLMKKLESSKNDVMTEAVLFEDRIESKKQVQAGTDRKLMIQEIDQAQLQSE
jgi:fructose-1,6-bisphosphatase